MRKKTTQIFIFNCIESLKKIPFFGTVWSLWPLEAGGLSLWDFYHGNSTIITQQTQKVNVKNFVKRLSEK